MFPADEKWCGLKRDEVSDKTRVLLWVISTEIGVDRLYPWVNIGTLPDDVLLEIFEFYLGKDDADKNGYYDDYDGWQTLVHVCCRWRCIVFASPRRLDLKLYCTRRRLVNSKTLDVWPTLPIVVYSYSGDLQSNEYVTNVMAALRHHDRVCKINSYSERFQDSMLEQFTAIDEPFPVLTSLDLTSFAPNVPVLPDSFLGGSAPELRSLHLTGIPYPSIGILLSSTTNLVRLSLSRIPHSGYISPATIVPCLSMLTRLKSLTLGFRYPRSLPHRTNRQPPPLTRLVFPNLTYLCFLGGLEYSEDILSRIETPMLNETTFYFFNQLVFNTPLLGHFIRRTETFMTINSVHVQFSDRFIQIILGRQEMTNINRKIDVKIRCDALDWQLSAVAQVLDSFLSSLPALETLDIEVSHKGWQDEIEVIQWQECLHPFTSEDNDPTIRGSSPAYCSRPSAVRQGKVNVTCSTNSFPKGFILTAIGISQGSHSAVHRYATILRPTYHCPLLRHQKWGVQSRGR
jgi:hypothetical protein